MSCNKKIEELYQTADFDKNGKMQEKVYSKINKTPKVFNYLWTVATAAAAITALLFLPQKESAPIQVKPLPKQQSLTQEECIDLSTRYWFEQAAEQGKLVMAKCPKEIMGDYNNNLIYRLNKEFEKSNNKLSQDEKRKLDDCGEKFKTLVKPIMSYDLHC